MSRNESTRDARTTIKQRSSKTETSQRENATPQIKAVDIVQRSMTGVDLPSASEMLCLQRSMGNRAVGQLIARRQAAIQAKLTVGAADDPYEREADRVASQVMRMQASPNADIVHSNDEEGMARRTPALSTTPTITPLVRRVARPGTRSDAGTNMVSSFDAGEDVERQIAANRGGGSTLPAKLRSELEPKFGADFSNVRVHTGAQSDSLNRAIGAQAFTHSSDIYMAAGKYSPGTGAGKQLLAHELTHVVQQSGANIRRFPQPSTTAAPAITRSPAGGQTPIQRTELHAVIRANQVHPGGHYVTWGGITAARALPVPQITANWKSIADAYVAAGPTFGGTGALDAEAGRLMADIRSWTDPQARREATAVLAQMVAVKRGLRNQLMALPDNAAKQHHINTITGQLNTLDARIGQIKTKFQMAHRAEGAGSETSRWFNNKKRTVLELPQGGNLELHNKTNPATNRDQNLGRGGLGYGAFGKLGGQTRFVKKQKMRKNEQSAEQGVGLPLYEQPEAIQAMQLVWIEQEMTKFRNELNITTNVLNHPNVIKSYGGAIGTGKDGMSKAYMAMDMMTGGDLNHVIAAGTATDATKKAIMQNALDGLAHVHAAHLIHRDIKPDNIMLDSAGTAKLIDFGEAVPMDVNGEYRTRTKAGTAGYYHPIKIVLAEQGGNELIYDVSTDLYALQVTFQHLAPHNAALNAWLTTFAAVNDAATLSANLTPIVVP